MGSTGSGKFGTYHVETVNKTGSSEMGIGGGSGEVECPVIIENIRLEDVATSEYYVQNQALPLRGYSVYLNAAIYKGRLVVKVDPTDEIIGNLPTKYNFLINCIKKGMNYKGVVDMSGNTPIPFVVVTLHA